MKKLKINKVALSVATAFLMLTSIVSTVASASGGNEIKLTSDKNFAQAGDSINKKASLEPDKKGVAGFTIDLHYDPSKVTVYVPTDKESESTYNVGSKFSVITNYVASSGTIKIVGANLYPIVYLACYAVFYLESRKGKVCAVLYVRTCKVCTDYFYSA